MRDGVCIGNFGKKGLTDFGDGSHISSGLGDAQRYSIGGSKIISNTVVAGVHQGLNTAKSQANIVGGSTSGSTATGTTQINSKSIDVATLKQS